MKIYFHTRLEENPEKEGKMASLYYRKNLEFIKPNPKLSYILTSWLNLFFFLIIEWIQFLFCFDRV